MAASSRASPELRSSFSDAAGEPHVKSFSKFGTLTFFRLAVCCEDDGPSFDRATTLGEAKRLGSPYQVFRATARLATSNSSFRVVERRGNGVIDLIGTNPLLGCENVVCLLGPMLAEETMLVSYPSIMLLPHEEPMFGTDFWRDSALVRHLCNGDPSLLPRCARILALAVQSICTNDLLIQRCHGMVTAEAFLHMVCERYVVHLSDMGIVPLADSPLSLYDGLEPFETIDPKAKPQAQGTFIGPRHVRKSSYGGVVFVFPQTASSTSRAKEYWKLPYWLRAKSEYERCVSTLPFRSLLWRRDDGSQKSHPKTLLDMVRLVRHEMLSAYEGREGKPMTVGRYAAICSICEECDPWTGRQVAAPKEILMNETQMSGFLARPFFEAFNLVQASVSRGRTPSTPTVGLVFRDTPFQSLEVHSVPKFRDLVLEAHARFVLGRLPELRDRVPGLDQSRIGSCLSTTRRPVRVEVPDLRRSESEPNCLFLPTQTLARDVLKTRLFVSGTRLKVDSNMEAVAPSTHTVLRAVFLESLSRPTARIPLKDGESLQRLRVDRGRMSWEQFPTHTLVVLRADGVSTPWVATIGGDDHMVAYNRLTTVGSFSSVQVSHCSGLRLMLDGSPSSGAEEEERCRATLSRVSSAGDGLVDWIFADGRPSLRVITSSQTPAFDECVAEEGDLGARIRRSAAEFFPKTAVELSLACYPENSELEDNDASNWGTPDPSSLCVDSEELVQPSALPPTLATKLWICGGFAHTGTSGIGAVIGSDGSWIGPVCDIKWETGTDSSRAPWPPCEKSAPEESSSRYNWRRRSPRPPDSVTSTVGTRSRMTDPLPPRPRAYSEIKISFPSSAPSSATCRSPPIFPRSNLPDGRSVAVGPTSSIKSRNSDARARGRWTS